MSSPSGSRDVWTLPELVDYFRADAEIAENLTLDDFNNILNYSPDWIKLVRTALEYQGFDPRVILSQMIRNRKSYESQRMQRVEWDLRNVGDDLKVTATSANSDKFSNEESLARDANFLITVFLSRNNHISKIVQKSRGGVEDILSMLKEKYNINDDSHSSGTSLESRMITLPRIAGVFPGTAVRMFHDKVVKEIVTHESFPGLNKPDTHAICCPFLPSVCPFGLLDNEGNNFHSVMIWTAIKLDEIIHRKDKNFTPLIELLGYYRAGYQSAAVPEKSRVAIFKHIGLITVEVKRGEADALVLSNSAKALAHACYSSIGQIRVEDENHDLVMKIAKSGDMTLF